MIGTKQFEEVLYSQRLAVIKNDRCANANGTVMNGCKTCHAGKFVVASRTFELICAMSSNHHCPLSKAFLIIVTLCREGSNVERLDPALGSGLSLVARQSSRCGCGCGCGCCCSAGGEKTWTKFELCEFRFSV